MYVVLDTNALLLPFTEGTRIEEGIEALFDDATLVVPSCVLMELQQIARGNTNAARHARAAHKLAVRFKEEPTRLTGDDGILEVARRLGAVVVTNDRVLQSECTKSGLRVVVAREHGRLALMRSGSGKS
jgi:rRNA-processing protein FCF1